MKYRDYCLIFLPDIPKCDSNLHSEIVVCDLYLGIVVKYAVDGIVNFSNAPLNLATWMGLLFSFIAFLYLVFIIIKFAIYGDPVQGWATTICVILIIGGIQLFSIGVMGQYIGKTYMEVKDRPHYIISKTNKKDSTNIK